MFKKPLDRADTRMTKKFNILILFTIFSFLIGVEKAQAEPKTSFWGWNKEKEHYDSIKRYNPYLENSRHVQIPQWAHQEWYAEDWLTQKDGMELIQGFYKADILRDQIVAKQSQLPNLVVGPNFYHLSGYDKRRVVHIVNVVYGMTASKPDGAFMLSDWYTKKTIGLFDDNGLTLH